jgi:hypothetical protein
MAPVPKIYLTLTVSSKKDPELFQWLSGLSAKSISPQVALRQALYSLMRQDQAEKVGSDVGAAQPPKQTVSTEAAVPSPAGEIPVVRFGAPAQPSTGAKFLDRLNES